jgi:hypothetical protein
MTKMTTKQTYLKTITNNFFITRKKLLEDLTKRIELNDSVITEELIDLTIKNHRVEYFKELAEPCIFDLYISNIKEFTVLERTLLSSINYFIFTNGSYTLHKTSLYKKFESIHTPKEVDLAIKKLINDGWLIKETKLVIFNERYSTQIRLKLNI